MDTILIALTELAQPFRLLLLLTGVLIGLVVGVVPGIGGIFGLSLLVPLTYHLDPYAAFALLMGMLAVVNTSDTIPAILIGVPGTVGAVATVTDGHPMARQGQAARAFGAAYTASMIGGVAGALLLALAIPVMRPLVLYLKTPDFFAISAFGLSVVAVLAGSQPLKGLAAALLGMLLAFIGIDANEGAHRWTFGQVHLWEGLPIVVVFLGLFGLPELAALMLRGAIEDKKAAKIAVPAYRAMFAGAREALQNRWLVLRCSGIGAALGAVPGVGVAAIDWIAYGHAARDPGKGPAFGHGNIRGVIAPEAANNAKEGGSLIPTIAFGIPGSAPMAIMLGAFLVQGIVPGPEMLGRQAPLTVTMVFSLALANIFGALICLLLTRPLARAAQLPAGVILPPVLALMLVGCFQTSMSLQDFVILGGIGFLGMAMKELNWPRSAFSLGFVLAPTLERNFFLAYQIHGLNWLGHPVTLGLLLLAALGVARGVRGWLKRRHAPRALPPALPDAGFALALAALALAALLSAARFPFAAGLFPMLCAGVLLPLALLIAAGALARRNRPAPALPPEGEWSPTGPGAAAANLRLMALAAGGAGALLGLGHLAGSFLFIGLGLWRLGRLPALKAALIAAGAAGFIWLIFDLVVARPWPEPLLQPLLQPLLRWAGL